MKGVWCMITCIEACMLWICMLCQGCVEGREWEGQLLKKIKIKLLCKLETWTGSFVWHRMNADFLAVSLKVLGSNAPVSLWYVFVCMFLLCLDGYPLVTHASSYSSKPFMILNWLWVWMCRGSVICPGYTLPPTPWQLGEAPSSARISGSKWWLHFIILGSTCTEVRTVYVKDG